MKLSETIHQHLAACRDRWLTATALTFLHELSHPHWPAEPTPGQAWADLKARPETELAAAIREALQIEAGRFPHQLEGAFTGLADENLEQVNLPALMAEIEKQTGRFTRGRSSEPFNGRLAILGALHETINSHGTRRTNGEFYTPTHVATLMALVAGPAPGEWIYEPTCGAGNLILAHIAAARDQLGHHAAKSITYIGIELTRSAQLARMNLVLAAADDQACVFQANALRSVIVGKDNRGDLRQIEPHAALSNPPFGTNTHLDRTDEITVLEIPGRLLNRVIPAPANTPAVNNAVNNGLLTRA